MSEHVDPTTIREKLSHPVIDADGHTLEYLPALAAYMREEGIRLSFNEPGIVVPYPDDPSILEMVTDESLRPLRGSYMGGSHENSWYAMDGAERLRTRTIRPLWWGAPTGTTMDYATASMPRLLHQRLDSLGFDFAVVYPTRLRYLGLEDEDLRRGACRAVNRYHADVFADLRDRLEPVALVPAYTPQEAVEELRYAVEVLGFKAVMLPGYVRRPIRAVAEKAPELARHAMYMDLLALDSEYDYEPLWAACVELGVSPAVHTGSMGLGTRLSVSSSMFNHIGHFAAAHEATCKALFFGGVTNRHPSLRIGFLEGGAGWAQGLLNDLVSHWQKRNVGALDTFLDPANLDLVQLATLIAEYGPDQVRPLAARAPLRLAPQPEEADKDEWRACGVSSAQDIARRFVPNFYFGCEADDPMVVTAFDRRCSALGERLSAMFGSDIGHWDVQRMDGVLHEAWESVEHERLDEQDFRDFTCANAVRFYTETNPRFFEGTRVAQAVS